MHPRYVLLDDEDRPVLIVFDTSASHGLHQCKPSNSTVIADATAFAAVP